MSLKLVRTSDTFLLFYRSSITGHPGQKFFSPTLDFSLDLEFICFEVRRGEDKRFLKIQLKLMLTPYTV